MFVDLFVVDLSVVNRDSNSGVVRQVELGAHVDLGGEDNLLAIGDLSHLDVGLTNGDDLVLLDRAVVGNGQSFVDRFLKNRSAADALIDDGRRNLALAESGDRHLRGNSLVGVRDVLAHVVKGDLNGQLDAGGRNGLD